MVFATCFQAALQERPQPVHLQTRRLCGWPFRPFSSSFRALVDVFRTGNWVWALGDPWWLMLPTIPHVVILRSSAARMAAKHLPTAQAVGLSFAAAVSVCARGHGRSDRAAEPALRRCWAPAETSHKSVCMAMNSCVLMPCRASMAWPAVRGVRWLGQGSRNPYQSLPGAS